jgi:hypothetical protein
MGNSTITRVDSLLCYKQWCRLKYGRGEVELLALLKYMQWHQFLPCTKSKILQIQQLLDSLLENTLCTNNLRMVLQLIDLVSLNFYVQSNAD